MPCEHRPSAHVATEGDISRQCLSKWMDRYASAATRAHSTAPTSHCNRPARVTAIERLRQDGRWSARRIACELAAEGHGVSVTAVVRWLVRLGISPAPVPRPERGRQAQTDEHNRRPLPGHRGSRLHQRCQPDPRPRRMAHSGPGSDHAKTVDRMMALVELRQTCSRTCSPEWLADEGGSPSMLMVSDHESATSRETRLLMLTRYDGLKIHALH